MTDKFNYDLILNYEDLSVIEAALAHFYQAAEVFSVQDKDLISILIAKISNALDKVDTESGNMTTTIDGLTKQ